MNRTDMVLGTSFFLGITLMAVGLVFDMSWLALIGIALFCIGLGYKIGTHTLS